MNPRAIANVEHSLEAHSFGTYWLGGDRVVGVLQKLRQNSTRILTAKYLLSASVFGEVAGTTPVGGESLLADFTQKPLGIPVIGDWRRVGSDLWTQMGLADRSQAFERERPPPVGNRQVLVGQQDMNVC
jgi:hypothetical protein